MKLNPAIIIIPLFILSACLDVDNDGRSEIDNTADIEFLEENAEKEGVTVTSSGLQYRVIEEGDGDSPEEDSRVVVHYIGKFIDGVVFQSTHDMDEPPEIQVDAVIQGFSEGLLLMREGSEYELVLPAELAYGDAPPINSPIYPGATLVFEVELLEILPDEE